MILCAAFWVVAQDDALAHNGVLVGALLLLTLVVGSVASACIAPWWLDGILLGVSWVSSIAASAAISARPVDWAMIFAHGLLIAGVTSIAGLLLRALAFGGRHVFRTWSRVG